MRQIDHLGTIVPVLDSEEIGAFALRSLRDNLPLSVVRMSDGEEKILSYCKSHSQFAQMQQFEPEWRQRYGVAGISCGEMRQRLEKAATECTYFAPDGGEEFFLKHFPARYPFAEIYFPHRWTRLFRIHLLRMAGSVLIIHAHEDVYKRVILSSYCPKLESSGWISLKSWRDSERVIEEARRIPSRLVLASCGPASKYIVPEIAKAGKVVLDFGSGLPHFWCIRGEAHCADVKCGAVAKEQ